MLVRNLARSQVVVKDDSLNIRNERILESETPFFDSKWNCGRFAARHRFRVAVADRPWEQFRMGYAWLKFIHLVVDFQPPKSPTHAGISPLSGLSKASGFAPGRAAEILGLTRERMRKRAGEWGK